MSEEKTTNVNLNINDGDAFFANEISINFNPTHFFVDFKCVSPRVDPRNQSGATFALKHNVVILDPFAVREMAGMLQEIIKRYEADFGKIDKPKGAKEADKMKKKASKVKAKAKTTVEAPGYFG